MYGANQIAPASPSGRWLLSPMYGANKLDSDDDYDY